MSLFWREYGKGVPQKLSNGWSIKFSGRAQCHVYNPDDVVVFQVNMGGLDTNCGMAFLCNWFSILPQELMQEVLELIAEECRVNNYTMIYTGLNEAQENVADALMKAGWRNPERFISRRTKVQCGFYSKYLGHSEFDKVTVLTYRGGNMNNMPFYTGDNNVTVE